MLHNDVKLFEDIVLRTSDYFGVDAAIIEKDYYVTITLKALSDKLDDMVFKGGTSLTKCYQLLNRFSEDIDLILDWRLLESAPKKSLGTAQ